MSPRSAILYPSLVTLLLCGCVVGPDFHSPRLSLPSRWSESRAPATPATNPAELAAWWRKFHDPLLTSLVEQAVCGNLDVKQAISRVRQARAQRALVGAPFVPSLGGSGSASETDTFGSKTGSSKSYHAGLNLSWEPDFFGGNRRKLESADSSLLAAQDDLQATRLLMASETALAYCQLRTTQEQIAAARRNLTIQQHSAEITVKRQQAGFVSALDVANSQALVANTQAEIPRLETAASQSIHALSVLLGRAPGDLISLLSPTRPIPTTSSRAPVGVPSDILRRRPDIRRAEHNAHSATANIGVAVADLYPKFTLGASLGQQSSRLGNWLTPSARAVSAGPSFNWALFQGGAVHDNIRIQQTLREQSVLTYRKAVLTALQEVEDALVACNKEQERANSLATALDANRRAADLSTKLYAEGQTDFLNVLNAERSLLQSESDLAQSNGNRATAMINLYKALGGGW